MRDQDAGFTGASVHVTDAPDAQATVIDVDTARQFDFGSVPVDRINLSQTSGEPASNQRNQDKKETKNNAQWI